MQAENANALCKNSSDSETDRLQDIQEEPRRCIGPSRVKELAKFFTPSSDEEDHSRVNTRQDTRSSLSQKRRREGVMKRNKLCNLTFKAKTQSFKDSALFPREIIVISLLVLLVRS